MRPRRRRSARTFAPSANLRTLVDPSLTRSIVEWRYSPVPGTDNFYRNRSLADDRAVFEFASTPDSAPAGEVTVQLPDSLVEVLRIDGVTVPVRSVTLRSQEVTSTSLCAVEGSIEFNEGGEAVATAPTRTADDVDGEEDPGIADLNLMLEQSVLAVVSDLVDSGELPKGAYEEAQKASYEYYKANIQGKDPGLDAQVSEMEEGTLSSDDDKASEKKGLKGMTPANWVARFYGVMMAGEGSTLVITPYGSEALPMSQFDPNNPKKGVFMDSPESFVEVLPCTTAADDTRTTVIGGFHFRRVDSTSESGSSGLACIMYSVMKDGTLAIPDADVDGYVRDSAGSWVQDRN